MNGTELEEDAWQVFVRLVGLRAKENLPDVLGEVLGKVVRSMELGRVPDPEHTEHLTIIYAAFAFSLRLRYDELREWVNVAMRFNIVQRSELAVFMLTAKFGIQPNHLSHEDFVYIEDEFEKYLNSTKLSVLEP